MARRQCFFSLGGRNLARMENHRIPQKLEAVQTRATFLKFAVEMSRWNQADVFNSLFPVALDSRLHPFPIYGAAADLLVKLDPRCERVVMRSRVAKHGIHRRGASRLAGARGSGWAGHRTVAGRAAEANSPSPPPSPSLRRAGQPLSPRRGRLIVGRGNPGRRSRTRLPGAIVKPLLRSCSSAVRDFVATEVVEGKRDGWGPPSSRGLHSRG
jgi:hypothetical protein